MACSQLFDVLDALWGGRDRNAGGGRGWPRRLAVARDLGLRRFEGLEPEVAHENVSGVDGVGAGAAVVSRRGRGC
jgi:hypothetical protein